MKQLAIISQGENDIESKLSDCVKGHENAGLWVYATHRGRGYAVIWTEDHQIDRAVPALRDAGFDVAPLSRSRSPQITTPAPAISVSNQDSRDLAALRST